jgi:hypothetical protein
MVNRSRLGGGETKYMVVDFLNSLSVILSLLFPDQRLADFEDDFGPLKKRFQETGKEVHCTVDGEFNDKSKDW